MKEDCLHDAPSTMPEEPQATPANEEGPIETNAAAPSGVDPNPLLNPVSK